ncbi:hypothetical protein [Bowmanella pacifica]|uniref:Negative modulator of initiation of replication n=1 Tax=Bowmanella pacifica TaxID=502051 RepID=A0A917Z0J8_9ALTE|nr:hypothetical protein [Bowmanella pacifica]GGO70718.1 negative modulator of initiation of replication [Bowmanella pacifica]
MKNIEIDEELYRYIAAQTQHIGESASQILRRLLFSDGKVKVDAVQVAAPKEEAVVAPPVKSAPVAKSALPVQEGALFDYLEQAGVAEMGSVVERFIEVLAALARFQGKEFAKVLELKGRNRTYFAISKEELLAAGSSTNPKMLPGSCYWVVTNNNTRKKLTMIMEVAKLLGYSDSDATRLARFLDAEFGKDAE